MTEFHWTNIRREDDTFYIECEECSWDDYEYSYEEAVKTAYSHKDM